MKILYVCTGNIMRSVIAECVTLKRAFEIFGTSKIIDVSSCGIKAMPDSNPHPSCLKALSKLGIEKCDVRSSQVNEGLLSSSDLVITMTREQSYQLASMYPEYSNRVFSIIELNGAIESLVGNGEEIETFEPEKMPPKEACNILILAAKELQNAPREKLRPLPKVPLSVRELMTLFPGCFRQVSSIEDPLEGTENEIMECALLIDREVTLALKGLALLGLKKAASARNNSAEVNFFLQ